MRLRTMSVNASPSRFAITTLVLGVALAASGCSWFSKENKLYAGDPTTRPLEVPPDLDLPRSEGAMAIPAGAAAPVGSTASAPAAPAVANGFLVAGSRAEVFPKVGEALGKIEGLTIASRAELLGIYDVSFQDNNFLVRVNTVEAGAYVSAVDPRGQPANGEAPSQVIAALKAALGGN
jgi:uncharacterized lipoprotein